MLSRKQLALLSVASLGLLAFCLLAPIVAALAFLRPVPYPNATFTRMRLPTVATLFVDGCLRTTLVSRSNYESPDKPNDILHWYQAAGWLINFRYGDSVLHQARQNLGVAKVNSVKEIFVDRAGNITLIAAAMQYTLSVGAC
jgi:hypothetical protein